jgi:hypothetical protein
MCVCLFIFSEKCKNLINLFLNPLFNDNGSVILMKVFLLPRTRSIERIETLTCVV